MIKKRLKVFSLLMVVAAMLGVATIVYANVTENIFLCTNYGFILGRCKIENIVLNDVAREYKDHGEVIEADFYVKYSFTGVGHAPNIGVKNGNVYKQFQLGANQQLITNIVGNQQLITYDPDPSLTRRLSYRPGVSLVIHEVGYVPSQNTITLWKDQLTRQTKLTNALNQLYNMTLSFEDYVNWDTTKCQLLLNSINQKIEEFKEYCELDLDYTACDAQMHFTTLKVVLQNKMSGSPAGYTNQEIKDSGLVASAYYKKWRDEEAAALQTMIDRFNFWKIDYTK